MVKFRQWCPALVAGSVLLVVAAALAPAPANSQAADVPPRPPLGLPLVQWPPDNPYSSEKVELGKLLFFDKRLSSDATVSCASCHLPSRGFGDQFSASTGVGGRIGTRHAPSLINRAYGTW